MTLGRVICPLWCLQRGQRTALELGLALGLAGGVCAMLGVCGFVAFLYKCEFERFHALRFENPSSLRCVHWLFFEYLGKQSEWHCVSDFTYAAEDLSAALMVCALRAALQEGKEREAGFQTRLNADPKRGACTPQKTFSLTVSWPTPVQTMPLIPFVDAASLRLHLTPPQALEQESKIPETQVGNAV